MRTAVNWRTESDEVNCVLQIEPTRIDWLHMAPDKVLDNGLSVRSNASSAFKCRPDRYLIKLSIRLWESNSQVAEYQCVA